jgi:nitrate reductase gamma subunit
VKGGVNVGIGAIIALIIGILALVRGKVPVSKYREARGAAAYFAGVLLLLPFLVGLLVTGAAHPHSQEEADNINLWLIGSTVAAYVIAVAILYLSAKPKT